MVSSGASMLSDGSSACTASSLRASIAASAQHKLAATDGGITDQVCAQAGVRTHSIRYLLSFVTPGGYKVLDHCLTPIITHPSRGW